MEILIQTLDGIQGMNAKENYEKIILEVLKNKELGLIYKPKHPQSLKSRIGSIYELLIECCSTGRCLILDQKTNYQSPVPAVLAGCRISVFILIFLLLQQLNVLPQKNLFF